MTSMRSISRASGLLATMFPLAIGVACSDPDLASELDTEGAPEVLEVNIASQSAQGDPNGNAIEAATFCRAGEEFQISTFYCPEERDETDAPIPGRREVEPLLDATPIDWHVSFIFSELLDPDIEKLVEEGGVTNGSLEETQPAILRCGGEEIPYGGYYDPSGSYLSYPPGPRLVIQTIDFVVATGTADCEVELKEGAAVDKDGEEVPGDHLGPYAFGIAPLTVLVDDSDPADKAEGTDPTAPVKIQFNAPINFDTLADKVSVSGGGAEATLTLEPFVDPDTEEDDESAVLATPSEPLTPNTMYTVTVDPGVTDVLDGPLDEGITFSFTTGEG